MTYRKVADVASIPQDRLYLYSKFISSQTLLDIKAEGTSLMCEESDLPMLEKSFLELNNKVRSVLL